jgi:diguanylate cyclase (GGDEF)-like protein
MISVRRRVSVGAGAFLLYAAVVAVLVVFHDYPVHSTLVDAMPVGVALAAASVCAMAAVKAKDRLNRWFWGLFALATLCSAVAEATWAVYELVLGSKTPFPSFADLAWLASYPLSFAALMRLAGERRARRIAETFFSLDVVLFSIAGAALSWEFLMAPVIDSGVSRLAIITTLAYPIGDLLLLGALVSIALSATRRTMPRGTPWIVASVLVMLVAVVYTRLNAAGGYSTGVWVDAFWPLSYALTGTAAIAYLDGGAQRKRLTATSKPALLRARADMLVFVRRLSAYAAVLVAGVVTYDHFVLRANSGPFADMVVVVIATLIPILVLLRQHLISAEIQRLQTSLVTASQELEGRVVERTRELAAEKERLDVLNQAARDISRCVSVQEVLNVGAKLLTRAKPCATVAVSAPGTRGELQFACASNVPTTRHAQLRRVLRRFLSSNAANSDATPVLLDGATAMMLFPIVYRQMMLGAACMASDDPDCSLCVEESELIDNIISQLGVALDGVCRYDDARFLADNDALTGLANRRAITERLEQEVGRTQRAGSYFALIMMDVDKFKFVNDTYGHAVGDQVLVTTAGALAKAVRSGDILGRFGGDEFVAILPDTDLTGAAYVVERIGACLAEHAVAVKGASALSLHVSCGVAVFPDDGYVPVDLFRVADANMYQSKRRANDREAALDGHCAQALRDGQ